VYAEVLAAILDQHLGEPGDAVDDLALDLEDALGPQWDRHRFSQVEPEACCCCEEVHELKQDPKEPRELTSRNGDVVGEGGDEVKRPRDPQAQEPDERVESQSENGSAGGASLFDARRDEEEEVHHGPVDQLGLTIAIKLLDGPEDVGWDTHLLEDLEDPLVCE
jgi:hypothetical protein